MTQLIGELYGLQKQHGYLRRDDLEALAERRRVPLYRIEEIVTFYTHFRTTPPPKTHLAVCRDLPCHLAGAPKICSRLNETLAGDPAVEVHQVSCLGRCDRAPAALLNDIPLYNVSPESLTDRARSPESVERPPAPDRRRWRVDPYAGEPGAAYSLLRAAREQGGDSAATEIIEALKASGLKGMGGAGFPTGLKWELVRKERASPKYVICNADESEPGAFKDRVILEQLPHLVIEGMCHAALVTGARRGWIYLRHEYELERTIVQQEIDEARDQGILDANFDIEIFVSPGGYILGEETALLEALEDKRGEPRNKPPYPGQRGLHGKPTLINNVETFAFVPAIIGKGAEWWRSQGLGEHAGLKFVGVSGHIENPGVYEIPLGTTVNQLIEIAGGVKQGRMLKAFAPGGASSNFLPAAAADVALDFDSVAAAGSMLGAAALFVIADGTDMIETATNVVRFFRNESCGKCVPCRVGTEKVVAMLEDILAGTGSGAILDVLPELEETLAQTSICGLGQVALNPLTSALEHWGDELSTHLE